MDKTTAQRLVRTTFKAAFDRERYRRFISELCNGFDEAKAHNMLVPEAFAAHVKSCQRLGTFTSPDDELADVLIVHLTESWKLERTRTALRDFVAHKLKRGNGNDNAYKEAGLIAFVAPDLQSWRLSYVRMDYETKRDATTGKIRTEERLTPARRYSYLVGTEEECHTAQTRFLPLLQNTTAKPTLARIEEAFSIESVTKEFFNEYARLFKTTDEALTAVLAQQPAVAADFHAKNISTADFAKKLLGQIVFLYFIQKKGWLGVAQDEPWGNGPRHFMRQLVDQAVANEQPLFNAVLEPLFYDTLATDRGTEAWCPRFQCRIPFLNGGLFEPLAGYAWEQRAIDLPNALFTNQFALPSSDVGSGILDVFDRYNFTVNEAEPLEKEVAIDPEMLGKVFENLIEENRRKGLGAFYTPREIVHYMCQESLINYLDTAVNASEIPPGPPLSKGGIKTLPRADIEALIREGKQAAHYETARKEGMVSYQRRLPEAIEQHAQTLDDALKTITVCDPAIGSGAFPVGMMTEIVRARAALTPYFNEVTERTTYHFKRHAIQNSLYGVDIDIGAVEIAKLRLWLSLVVDEEDIEQIKPLPNLDYKVIAGNSLLGVEKNLFNDEYFKRLEALKPQFFNESDRTKKADFKQQIEDLIHPLTKGREVFDFEIYFSEVFHAKGGFDVVVGNPPYVRHEEIKDLKPLLKPRYECFTGTADLFTYFYERGIKLLHNGGQFAFITSNKWYRSGYGEKLRGWLAKQTRIHQLIDFGDAPVFEAIAYPTIVLLERVAKKDLHSDSSFRALTWKPGPLLADFVSVVRRDSFEIPQRSLDPTGWRLEGTAKRHLLEKLRAAGTPLGEYCKGRFYRGILTGLNDAFVVDRATRDRLIAEHPSSAEVLKPFLRGRDVKRWRVDFADQYLIKIESSENRTHPWTGKSAKAAEDAYAATYPAIHAFHQQFRAGLIKRADQGKYFWELRSCAYWQEFEQPKIVYPDIALYPQFTWDNDHQYLANTAYIIPRVQQGLLSILNSHACAWFYSQISPQIQNGYYRFIAQYCQQIPIPAATPSEQAELETLVRRILENPTAGDVAVKEAEINEQVYRLFDLSREEIALIENDK
ncbi:MAG: Eco57I restriction-modification methylase domain-containing protein [Candidatus Competibacteraceae bacterium]